MTEDLIKKLKDVKQALVSKDMTGEENVKKFWKNWKT